MSDDIKKITGVHPISKGPSMSSMGRILEEVYTPILEQQIKDVPQWLMPPAFPKYNRRSRIKFWSRRVRDNIKDAWHVLWHGTDKFMEY